MSNGPPFRPITPRRQLDANEFGRLAEHTELQGQWLAGGNVSLIQTGAGTSIISRSGGGSGSRIPVRLTARRTSLGPPFPYSWIEQQEIGPARPGEWEDRPNGLVGTFTVDPAYDLNADQNSQAFDFTGVVVEIWLANFGVWYWFDGDETGGGTGPTGGDRFVLNLSSFPDAFGRHAGRLMVENADGTLTDPNPGGAGNVWLRDANNPGLLLGAAALHVTPPPTMTIGVIYKAKKTGYAAGGDVYTLKDFTLYVRDDVDSRGLLGAQTLVLSPYYTWDISFPVPRSVLIGRKFNVLKTTVLQQGSVWEQDLFPSANHWLVTTPGPGRVTIDRNLVVRKEFVAFAGQSIWQIIFASGSLSNLSWTVTNDLLGTVTVVRELNFNRGGFLVEARVWDVNFVPANNWIIAGGGNGSVSVTRVFNMRVALFPIVNTAPVWEQEYIPDWTWNLNEAGAPGRVTIERILEGRLEGGPLVMGGISELFFRGVPVQDRTWTIAQGVFPGRLHIARNLNVLQSAILVTNHVWEFDFDPVDFTVRLGNAGAGTVIVQTQGFTGTVGPFYKYLCINEELRELTSIGFPVIRGLVKGSLAKYS